MPLRRTPDTQQLVSQGRVALVGCVKRKQTLPCSARDLYVSPLFRKRKAYVERRCDLWFILSAKRGLVDPDVRLEPYDETLKGKSLREREAWSTRVLDALVQRLGALRGTTFEIHAGSDYRDHGIVEGLRRLGGRVPIPTQGMGIGRQLAFYSVAEQDAERPRVRQGTDRLLRT